MSSPAYRLGNSWVVADRANDRLLTLNETAYRIWQDWEQGRDAAAISRQLAEDYALSPAELLDDVQQTIAQWQTPVRRSKPATPDWRYLTRATLACAPDTTTAVASIDLRVQAAELRLHFESDEIAQAITPLFDHLATPLSAPTEYHVEALDDGYRLRQALRVIYQGPSLDLAAVCLLNEISLAGYRDLDPLCALHAAGVGRNGQCILLPGIAGAGKSTLTAALLHTGLAYLSDDTVPITRDRQALALRPTLCIKAGSVPVLASRYPSLADARVYRRADQPVRYFPPPLTGGKDRYQVSALVFPHYRPGSNARLTEIPADAAFSRLLQAGIFAHRPQDPAHLSELVSWIGGLQSYCLQYDSLDDACTQIDALFNDTDAFATSSTPEPLHEATNP